MPSDRIWTDGPFINSITTPLVTDVVLTMSQKKQIATLNVRRWAIGFVQPAFPQSANLAPWPEVADFVFANLTGTTQSLWYTIFNYGTLVANSWWIIPNASFTLRVVEMVRK